MARPEPTPPRHKARHLATPKNSPRAACGSLEVFEPDLATLLADPDVRLVMRADHVDERQLMVMFESLREHFQGRSPTFTGSDKEGSKPNDYRPGVRIMLLNARGEIFIARRADVQPDTWQMPQGGIDEGESPRQAAMRQLREGLGTSNADVIGESRDRFYRAAPGDVAQGQRLKWIVLLFKGSDGEIHLDRARPKFNGWRWASVRELNELAVCYERELYLNVIGAFATIFRD